ncbi:hypothetical protein CSOJ01_03576 [Colletotrichum sojae]|uniref:Uncharacterized protein n=1 Tax=Colletotrichum sojae TaxID=2175907 RepID=A0A8H6N0Q4_9PEZI|nr:hypothetical protein CSOJ01_03576 [Colletotrichum sojae]
MLPSSQVAKESEKLCGVGTAERSPFLAMHPPCTNTTSIFCPHHDPAAGSKRDCRFVFSGDHGRKIPSITVARGRDGAVNPGSRYAGHLYNLRIHLSQKAYLSPSCPNFFPVDVVEAVGPGEARQETDEAVC